VGLRLSKWTSHVHARLRRRHQSRRSVGNLLAVSRSSTVVRLRSKRQGSGILGAMERRSSRARSSGGSRRQGRSNRVHASEASWHSTWSESSGVSGNRAGSSRTGCKGWPERLHCCPRSSPHCPRNSACPREREAWKSCLTGEFQWTDGIGRCDIPYSTIRRFSSSLAQESMELIREIDICFAVQQTAQTDSPCFYMCGVDLKVPPVERAVPVLVIDLACPLGFRNAGSRAPRGMPGQTSGRRTAGTP
jgi:hypothetical protein